MGQDNPIMVEINSEGFRGPELKASPAQRIVFIGDSVVFNGYVQQKETFTALLEGQFRKDGHSVEIINAGTTDVGVKQYILQARHNRFDRYKPELIITGLYLNDSRPPQGFLGENQDQLFNFLSHSPLRHLAFTHYIKQAYVAWRTKRGDIYSERFDWIARFNSDAWKDDLGQFRQTVREARFDWGAAWYPSFKRLVYPAIMEIRDLYVKKGVKFAVVLFPVSLQVHTSLTDLFIDYPQRQLSMFAKKENVPFLDLLPLMRKEKNRRLFVDQAHLTRKGNQIVAHIIYPFLKGLLEK
ncbi:MAG: hypothetical protein ACE5J5_09030 [Candidatus Hydrothermarchaeales archaeon]